MTWPQATFWFLLATAILWAIWDVVAFLRGGKAATISKVISEASWYSPALPFLIGLLCGHFFFGMGG